VTLSNKTKTQNLGKSVGDRPKPKPVKVLALAPKIWRWTFGPQDGPQKTRFRENERTPINLTAGCRGL